jgi:uncharacterized membrane protein YgdD (TMEM256/DUF423 family)
MKLPLLFASLYGMTGVILGAFGAHALKDRLSPEQLVSWETGVRYQLVHAVALLVVAILMEKGLNLKPTMILFALGAALFSGSIYLLCFEVGIKGLWVLTPLGGFCLILGWGWLFVSAVRM